MERQTRQEYIHDLEVVQELVATMGDKALTNVEQSMKALLEDDAVLAKKVMKADDAIDDIFDYFMEADTDDLDTAVEELGGDYTDENIRLVRIKFISEVAN